MALKTNVTYEEKAETFLGKYLKKLTIALILVILAVIGFVIASNIVDSNNESNLNEIQVIENSIVLDDSDAEGMKPEEAIAALESYTNASGVTGARANLLVAELKYYNKDYQGAAESYIKAAEAQKSSYTAPVAYFNAAVCYESLETADFEKAVENYAKACEYDDYPKIDHALFSLGRANEMKGDIEAAKKAYEKLASRENLYPEISPYDKPYVEGWAYMAKSRLIALETK